MPNTTHSHMSSSQHVLLHMCCGVCAGQCIAHLQASLYAVTGFFYNPNIVPEEEYQRRLASARAVCDISGVTLIEQGYDNSEWEQHCGHRALDAERGERCRLCYAVRLKKTAQKARETNMPFFTSTLTISPHKNTAVILAEGLRCTDSVFLPIDFKKKDGFKKTMLLAQQHQVYRQNYCGCRFTIR